MQRVRLRRYGHGGKKILAVASVTAMATLSACTPKPAGAREAATDFATQLSAMASSHDKAGNANDDQPNDHVNKVADATDNKSAAEASITDSWKGLQAQDLKVSLKDFSSSGDVSVATYHYDWTLPKGRSLSYDAKATFAKTNQAWKVRWKPAVIHPDLGSDQHLELRALQADRAPVIGSDGQVLLEPGTQFRVLLNKHDSATINHVASILRDGHAGDAGVPTIDPSAVHQSVKNVNGDYSVAMVPSGAHDVVDALKAVDGVTLNEEPALVRPDPTFAPDILSRVSSIVNDELDGKNGWQVASVNPNGAVIKSLEEQQPTPAQSVKISLSKKVQDAAQKAVDTRADTEAMMVVIRPSTGEVLAVAQTANADKKGDLALTGLFPPGSTFKMVTATAGMQQGLVTPDSTVPCPGTMEIGSRVVHNYNNFSLGNVSLTKAFAQSCNTTFADVSSKLKPGELKSTAQQFGIGQDYKIDGLDTLTGQVPQADELVDRVEGGFGQGRDLASPFGMALVAATAAAGETPTPTLIESHKTTVKNTNVPTIDPQTIDKLRGMMRAVVTSGTARAIAGQGDVFGKTGEAEVSDGSHAWFAGYRGDLAFATLIPMGGGSEHSVAITQSFFQNLGGDE